MVYCAHRLRSLIHFPELQATPWARISWSLREFRSWSAEHAKGARNSEGSSRPSSTRPEPAPNPRTLWPPFRSRPWPQRAGRVPAGTQTPRGLCSCRPGRRRTPNRDTALSSPVRPSGRVGLALPREQSCQGTSKSSTCPVRSGDTVEASPSAPNTGRRWGTGQADQAGAGHRTPSQTWAPGPSAGLDRVRDSEDRTANVWWAMRQSQAWSLSFQSGKVFRSGAPRARRFPRHLS